MRQSGDGVCVCVCVCVTYLGGVWLHLSLDHSTWLLLLQGKEEDIRSSTHIGIDPLAHLFSSSRPFPRAMCQILHVGSPAEGSGVKSSNSVSVQERSVFPRHSATITLNYNEITREFVCGKEDTLHIVKMCLSGHCTYLETTDS